VPPDATPKALLRAQLRAARDALPARARARASDRVVERLLVLPELTEARVVTAFHPFGSEIAIERGLAALLARGVTLLLPWVDGPELRLARVDDLSALEPGWRGVPEPPPSGRIAVPPAEAEAVLVPGLAFDRRGGRLGYGGGHIDRLLGAAGARASVIAPAFALQVVPDVPREPHDVPVDILVTEDGVHRVAG
jgi:5-formyltetrahydrofolate cyclo-ligase